MTALLTPYDKSDAAPAGRNLFRKQLLPVAKINYKGRVIDFTPAYLADLVRNFNARAYDQVAFQLADKDNSHTEDPDRWRGDIAALELTDSGLDVIVAASDSGAKLLRENPRLGVSAKIVEDYERADGKFFPRALKHVLGTLDPRLTGMSPWQAIEAANDDGEVIDLTGAEYASGKPDKPAAPPQPEPEPPAAPVTEETTMAFTPEQEARLAKLLDLPDEKFDALLADPEPEDVLTDAELEELMAEIKAEGADGEPGTEPAAEPAAGREPAAAGAALSSEAQAAIDLANSRAEENALELATMRAALDKTTYEQERDALARKHGIPPRITDLARPLLEGTGRVVELANGKSIDAGAIVRKLLAEVGQTAKMLDLSAELGTEHDSGAGDAAAAEEARVAERNALKSGYSAMAGLR